MTKASSPKMLSRSAAALLERAQAYATLINRELSTVSSYLFNDGKVLKSLTEGGDIMTRALDRANDELDRRTAALQATAHSPMAMPVAKPKAPAKKKAVAKKAAPRAMPQMDMAAVRPRAQPMRQPAQAAAAKQAPKQTAPAAPAPKAKPHK